jgi:hypothetical protein
MNEQNSAAPVNSQAYWEVYFSGLWDQNNGRGQTTHFMQCLVQNLPEPEKRYLSDREAAVLDWGCAFGDGVAVLAESFPRCRLAGLDFAEAAIIEARRSFPKQEFIHADGGRLEREFDVIMTSNCLEHFENPLEVVESHLRWCRDFYVALVPYREAPLIDCHHAQFRDECFPEQFCGFTRVAALPVDVDQNYWTGQQLLVVYGSPAYCQLRAQLTKELANTRLCVGRSTGLPAGERATVLDGLGIELAEQLRKALPPSASILAIGAQHEWSQLAVPLVAAYPATKVVETVEVADQASESMAASAPAYDLSLMTGLIDDLSFDEAVKSLQALARRSSKYVLVLTRNAHCYWSNLERLEARSRDQVATTAPQAFDLEQAVSAAGLTVAGRTFIGSAWTESVIRTLLRGDAPLRDQVLRLQQTPLVSSSQKAHLVAVLCCPRDAALAAPLWQDIGANEAGNGDWRYAITDALGLVIAGEQRCRQLQSRLEQSDSKLRTLLCGPPPTPARELERIRQVEVEQRAALSAEIARLQEGLAAIENSKSWRLTKPLRVARGTLAPTGSERARVLRAVRREIAHGPRRVLGRAVRLVAKHTPPSVVARGKELARNWLPDRVRLQLRTLLAQRWQMATENSDAQLVRQRVDEFLARAAHSPTGKLFLIVSGTSFTTSEGQRPTRLARELARREIPVLFAYWRWNTNEPLPPEKSPYVLEIPFDWLVGARDFVFATPCVAQMQRSLLVEFPHSSLVGLVNEANVHGWRTIYDVIDDWEEFHQHGQAVWYEQDAERYLAHNTDMVTVTCPTLQAKPILSGLRNVKLVPNAFEDWTTTTNESKVPVGATTASPDTLTVGYFGHLTRAWFNWELIASTAEARPGWTFEIIGYGFEGDIRLPDNVKLLGKREHADLPALAAHWNVAMIPFRASRLTAAVDPIKIYEYISLGLPTVVTGMPHLEEYPGVKCAEGTQAFEQAIIAAASGRLDATTTATFLADNRWLNRVDTLLELVESDEHVSAVSLAIAEPVDRQERAA